MSKWKDKSVSIIHAFDTNNKFIGVIGLGDDSKLYEWDKTNGAWVKYWAEVDRPDE